MILLLLSISKSLASISYNPNTQNGIISLMYHRFDENKYPSTNIRLEIFNKHLEEIKKLNLEFISFEKFEKILDEEISKSYLLLTVDDAFTSFYLKKFKLVMV